MIWTNAIRLNEQGDSVKKVNFAIESFCCLFGEERASDKMLVYNMSTMSIKEIQEQIIEEFSIFDDWMDKYSYLIELGKSLESYNEKNKVDKYLIDGCQSRVWIYPEQEGKVLKFYADSDAIITKGIISLLIRVYSGHTAKEILDADLYFIDRIDLKDNLSPTRANGLLAMIKQIKLYAMAFDLAENKATNNE